MIIRSKLRTIIGRSLMNYQGWRTDKKIVVIESDDWGSIRMPSKSVYNSLLRRGIRVDKCLFSRYDTLESVNDLEKLFYVLNTVKDKNGNNAKFTANCVLANSDFIKIKESHYLKYYYEPISTTYCRYWGNDDVLKTYQYGIKHNLWKPQLHGREHLNISRWLKALQDNDELTRLCFDYYNFSLTTAASPNVKTRFMDSFGSIGSETLKQEAEIIEDAVTMYSECFKCLPKSFIAPCYIWRSELEDTLFNHKIMYIQSDWHQQVPINDNPLTFQGKKHYIGEKNMNGQIYTIRNVSFEPFLGESNEIDKAMLQIKMAFFWKKPAIICSHRINYVGGLDERQRDINLKKLTLLLKEIVKSYPDVEFMSSDELGDTIVGRI